MSGVFRRIFLLWWYRFDDEDHFQCDRVVFASSFLFGFSSSSFCFILYSLVAPRQQCRDSCVSRLVVYFFFFSIQKKNKIKCSECVMTFDDLQRDHRPMFRRICIWCAFLFASSSTVFFRVSLVRFLVVFFFLSSYFFFILNIFVWQCTRSRLMGGSDASIDVFNFSIKGVSWAAEGTFSHLSRLRAVKEKNIKQNEQICSGKFVRIDFNFESKRNRKLNENRESLIQPIEWIKLAQRNTNWVIQSEIIFLFLVFCLQFLKSKS